MAPHHLSRVKGAPVLCSIANGAIAIEQRRTLSKDMCSLGEHCEPYPGSAMHLFSGYSPMSRISVLADGLAPSGVPIQM